MKLKQFILKAQWKIAGLLYSVAFCKTIDEPSTLGYCEDETKIIYVKNGQTEDETFKTIVHELVHAMDYVYGMKLRHTQVRKLELALSDFLIQNGLIK